MIDRTKLAYLGLMVLQAMVAAAAVQLGKVPIASGWEWLVPILAAGLTALAALLPKVGGDGDGTGGP